MRARSVNSVTGAGRKGAAERAERPHGRGLAGVPWWCSLVTSGGAQGTGGQALGPATGSVGRRAEHVLTDVPSIRGRVCLCESEEVLWPVQFCHWGRVCWPHGRSEDGEAGLGKWASGMNGLGESGASDPCGPASPSAQNWLSLC